LSAYRLSLPYERPPLRRRASGLALALAINLALLLALLTLGKVAPERRTGFRPIVVDLLPESHSAAAPATPKISHRPVEHGQARPLPKLPPIVLPAKPTIAVPPASHQVEIVALSKEEMAAGDIANLPKAGQGSGGDDSEVVGKGPHGEVLYAAEWARHPTDAELGGYLPRNSSDGWGLIACKTIPGDRVEDCVELDQEPRGSHLASAVRQAAWQFRIRPPRKNGMPLIGSWVSIRIDYEHVGRSGDL
jgi:protein TonB